MRRRTAFGLVVLLLGVAGTSVGWFFGQTYAEQRLQIMLSAAIGQPVSLTLRSIGLSQSQLANIRIGNEPAMTIPTLALD